MRAHRLQKWLIASVVVAMSVTPVAVIELSSGVAGATTTSDAVNYVQSASSSSYVFVPGNGGAKTTQTISPSGTCRTPTTTSAGMLAPSALVYKNLVSGVPYTGPSSTGTVGTKSGMTGVCDLSPSNAINQNESLFFALGANALVTGRTMSEAKLPLTLSGDDDDDASSGPRGDWGGSLSATVKLIEHNGSSVVGTQSVTVTGDGDGDQDDTTTADTGVIAGGFTALELQVTAKSSQTAVSVTGTSVFTLLQLPQTITFTNTPPSNPIVGDSYTVTATGGGSGQPVVLSLDGSSVGCTLNPSTGFVNLVGPANTCIVDANQAGNGTYAPAPQAQQSVAFSKAPQTITFTSTPPSDAVAGDTYTPMATGGASGNPVVFTIDAGSASVCSIDPSTSEVTFNAPGSCVIDANQSGNASYYDALQVQQTEPVYQTICGQQTKTTQSVDGTNGQDSASFTFLDYQNEPAPPSVCKTYSLFTASANNTVPGLTGNQTVTFDSNPLATAHMTATITWAPQSFCTPDGSNGTTQCPPTYVSFDDGQTWQPQTYCTSAETQMIEWCTTGRSYTITPAGTQITETWDGYGDPTFHHG